MSNAPKQFFALDKSLRVMKFFLLNLTLPASSDVMTLELRNHVERIVEIISNNSKQFDNYCPINIEWIGESFLSNLANFNIQVKKPYDQLLTIFVETYRFISEFEFSQPNELSTELRVVQSFVDENIDKFPANIRRQIINAQYAMPAAIMKKILYSQGIADAKAFSESFGNSVILKQQWDAEISSKLTELNSLKGSISNLTESYNFVGLVDGFKKIAKDKASEKNVAFWTLIFLTFTVLTPLLFELIFILNNLTIIENHKQILLYSLPAIAALEFILIYFFRIVLTHFRSVKAQILQLNLRMSLCQFIQSYADYSKKIKKDDPNALEKFESIIFSGILTNEEKIPSTFDGIEQISKFVKSLKD